MGKSFLCWLCMMGDVWLSVFVLYWESNRLEGFSSSKYNVISAEMYYVLRYILLYVCHGKGNGKSSSSHILKDRRVELSMGKARVKLKYALNE